MWTFVFRKSSWFITLRSRAKEKAGFSPKYHSVTAPCILIAFVISLFGIASPGSSLSEASHKYWSLIHRQSKITVSRSKFNFQFARLTPVRDLKWPISQCNDDWVEASPQTNQGMCCIYIIMIEDFHCVTVNSFSHYVSNFDKSCFGSKFSLSDTILFPK